MITDPTCSADAPRAGTRGDWVRCAAEAMESAGVFFGHGTANALDEASWMVSHVCELAPDFEPSEFDRALRTSERDALDNLLKRRIETRRPLAYLIGEAWFAGLKFKVDNSTLVPRSPLAEIVMGGLLPWQDFTRPLRVLDVGTGSGCIAIALAVHWPELDVSGVDISADALRVARQNAEAHGVAARVHLVESDVYAGVDGERFDLIITNPPYVPAASMHELPAEYRHEPELALAAGEDGLSVFRRLLAGAPDHLTSSGLLLIELGEAAPAAEALLAHLDAVWLEFEHGGDGVVLLDRAACCDFANQAEASASP